MGSAAGQPWVFHLTIAHQSFPAERTYSRFQQVAEKNVEPPSTAAEIMLELTFQASNMRWGALEIDRRGVEQSGSSRGS